jgi:hypothetical protein
MSDLLPNLGALLEQLAGDSAGKRDARDLAEAVAVANTEEDLDRAIDAVINTWGTP